MMHSPLGRTLAKVAWVLTALAAIHIGLLGLGIDLLHAPLVKMNLHWLVRPIDLIIGLAGLYSLVSFFTCTACDDKAH